MFKWSRSRSCLWEFELRSGAVQYRAKSGQIGPNRAESGQIGLGKPVGQGGQLHAHFCWQSVAQIVEMGRNLW
jgi:hypothetical protein